MTFTIVSIEGNIGSGKSTLLDHLKLHYKNDPRIVFAPEPVSEWEKIKDKEGVTMLEKFYSNQDKYAFPFQMMAYMSRLSIFRRLIREAKEDGDKHIIIITERSLYTDKYVFAKMLYDQGKIEEVNYQIYLTWFNEFANELPIEHVFYIKADPETCYERIHLRARAGELIPITYLTMCHTYHNEYIKNFEDTTVLNGNENIKKYPHILEQWIDQIHSVLEKKN